jgi:hypothetical protein
MKQIKNQKLIYRDEQDVQEKTNQFSKTGFYPVRPVNPC